MTDEWEEEVDFISVGSGIGGLAAAITAHELGLRALVLEKDVALGGVTAYSGGQLWLAGNPFEGALGIDDSWERGAAYLEHIGAGTADASLLASLCSASCEALAFFIDRIGLDLQVVTGLPDYFYGVVDDGVAEGRYLEVRPFPGASLGPWQDRTRVTPYYPYGLTGVEMQELGGGAAAHRWDCTLLDERRAGDQRCMGPGLAATFVKGAADRAIPMLTSSPVTGLLSDGSRVLGVQAEVDGQTVEIGARRGVLLATSGFDWNAALVELYDHRRSWGSRAPSSVTGDQFALAGTLGARTASFPKPVIFGFSVPGELTPAGDPLWRRFEAGLPHAAFVNRAGRRFADESFYMDVNRAFERIDGATQSRPNDPFWAVFDSQHRRKYPAGGFAPEEELPAGVFTSAPTVNALACALGIDAAGLADEVTKLNEYSRIGVDDDFARGENAWARAMCCDPDHRPNPSLGSIEEPPFHAVLLVPVGLALASTGLVGDRNGNVVDHRARTIPGLYAAGNALAATDIGAGYQSGIGNTRGMVYGHLAARHAAEVPSR